MQISIFVNVKKMQRIFTHARTLALLWQPNKYNKSKMKKKKKKHEQRPQLTNGDTKLKFQIHPKETILIDLLGVSFSHARAPTPPFVICRKDINFPRQNFFFFSPFYYYLFNTLFMYGVVTSAVAHSNWKLDERMKIWNEGKKANGLRPTN